MKSAALFLGLILSLPCHAASTTVPTRAQALPAIRVARDGKTFVTNERTPFVPFGVNYYRPGTGWAPQLWKKFDTEATRADLARMKEFGINCVRVFLTYGSFYTDAGVLRSDGLEKFDRFLTLAEDAGIYVHPTGPDHWEGMPHWQPVSIENEQTLAALEAFWKLFAAHYAGRNVIFAYDLKNEPEVPWNAPGFQERWNAWLKTKYRDTRKLVNAWHLMNRLDFGNIPIPPDKDALESPQLLDYQDFREGLADEWTRRQVAAIKSVAPQALVTVGLIQWSVPYLLPGGVRHYAAFRPQRQARFLDFLEIHFYPLAQGAYEYQSETDEIANLAYLECVVRETAKPGKPVVLAEFGWYGGGKPKFDGGRHPAATQEQHARYCRRVVETSAGLVTGWLNWGFYDQPEATDCSEMTGLLTTDGQTKAWGTAFRELTAKYAGKRIPPAKLRRRPDLDWSACLTSMKAEADFRQAYLDAFLPHERSR
ncbi:MAG TPA: cellulase family glycosylhydrolase [Verrucomicrobiae bacterium]